MATELDIAQPSMSRILSGRLKPGRKLAASIETLFLVPMAWWETPEPKEADPVPSRPSRYEAA